MVWPEETSQWVGKNASNPLLALLFFHKSRLTDSSLRTVWLSAELVLSLQQPTAGVHYATAKKKKKDKKWKITQEEIGFVKMLQDCCKIPSAHRNGYDNCID